MSALSLNLLLPNRTPTLSLPRDVCYFRVDYPPSSSPSTPSYSSPTPSPFSLLVLVALLAAGCFLYLFCPADPPLVLLSRRFSDETLAGLVVPTVFVVFLTSIGFPLISALTVGVALVCVDGAFRAPKDLFLDDRQPRGAASGFLSFLGGVASSAATFVGPGGARHDGARLMRI